MKKLIITIIAFVLIALGFILYKNYSITGSQENTAFTVKSFVNKMIPHHTEAIVTSTQVMNDVDVTDPAIRIFAANVVDKQNAEVDFMKNISHEYLGADYVADGSYHSMMSDLSNLKGDQLAKVYVKEMIRHHEMAIDMAKEYVKTIDKINKSNTKKGDGLSVTNSHPAIDESYALAKRIIEDQTKEIVVLKGFFNN